ncbi:L-serine ammonia-lyase, iron-sulfur-dependent, subunit alpha [Desulfovibrio aminophilus]|uniref:L-serine ammonia-lyase, iron-sulfur-dependent, subunit alpha n=1 Tax=Desulfovibrio aminophilus TaxID=81425 RepID=UPI0033956393
MPDTKRMEPASIFNDVLGPVMTGPSSSHTAGPTRIGLSLRLLLGEEIAEARIRFKADGSYPGTYRGQGTDMGFIGGLLGFGPENKNLIQALDIATKRGLSYVFETETINHPHPNTARIILKGVSGRKMEFLTLSTGGGMFHILELNGHAVSVRGEFWELFASAPDASRLDVLCETARRGGARIHRAEGREGFVQITAQRPFAGELLREADDLAASPDCSISQMPPVLPVSGQFEYSMPFMIAAEALARRNGDETLADLAIRYERARSGQAEDEMLGRMGEIIRVMRRAAESGLRGGLPTTGYLRPKAADMLAAMRDTIIADIGVMNRSLLIATAIMEYNSSSGIVVAAPTAGSCGVLPAVVLALAEAGGRTEEEQAKAMLAAGLIGVFIAHQATFAAEVCACQAEIGSATAMAAAAAVQLLGGDARQGMAAAALALQNVLGLICDPVAGLVEIPCVNRNSMGAANALVSANMVLCGFDPVIPLDEVILVMRDTGERLPPELRCTNRGGLCLARTSLKLEETLVARSAEGGTRGTSEWRR